jgi:hypothetical protein
MRLKYVLVFLFAATAAVAQQAPPPALDFAAIKRETQLFETVLNTAVQQRFEQPFLLLQETKGAYLEGYGVVFTLEVSLYPMRLRTPFAAAPYSDKELVNARTQKLQRTKEMETLIRDLLRDHGMGLRSLPPDESIAVVVHLFNQTEQRDMPTQLAVQVKKQWLQEAAGRKLNAAEFRLKLSVVSF